MKYFVAGRFIAKCFVLLWYNGIRGTPQSYLFFSCMHVLVLDYLTLSKKVIREPEINVMVEQILLKRETKLGSKMHTLHKMRTIYCN